jgi:hypothetical protein
VAVSGSGLSQQAWRLVPKMAEVEELAAQGVVLTEVHPELAFATVAGAPLPRKRSWPGLMLRREILAGSGVELPTASRGTPMRHPTTWSTRPCAHGWPRDAAWAPRSAVRPRDVTSSRRTDDRSSSPSVRLSGRSGFSRRRAAHRAERADDAGGLHRMQALLEEAPGEQQRDDRVERGEQCGDAEQARPASRAGTARSRACPSRLPRG